METAKHQKKQSFWSAAPGSLFVGCFSAIVASAAISVGSASVGMPAKESALTVIVAGGAAGFMAGVVATLLMHKLYGTTVGSIGQAIKDLWEALGKWHF